MNKKLLAVAIAGVLAAPLAQAQTANVTLYGRLNLSSQVIINAKQDASGGGIKQNIYQVGSNSSRLGVRGTESLGGGLNALFQIEERFDASNGSLVTTTGDSFVGLQGGWGTGKIGYFLTPYDDVAPVFGSVPTLISSILSTSALWSNTGPSDFANGGFDNRAGNSLRYDSPVISGFTFSGQVAARDTGSTVSSDGGTLDQQRRHAYILGVGSTYNNGPWGAAVAYQVHNNIRNGAVAACVTCPTNANAKLQDQGITAALSYTFGAFKIAGVYEYLKYDTPSQSNAAGVPIGTTVTSTGEIKRNLWGISGTANLGPGQLYAAYFKANNGSGSANCVTTAGLTSCPRVGSVTIGPDSSSQMWEVSYTYPLSKRTLLYTGYVMIDNSANANYNFNVGAVAGLCGGNSRTATGNTGCGDAARPQGVLAGIVHFW
jgi:predicted porin